MSRGILWLLMLILSAASTSWAQSGTLILDGGGATPLVLKHFVERAGGRSAPIVIVPTGATSW